MLSAGEVTAFAMSVGLVLPYWALFLYSVSRRLGPLFVPTPQENRPWLRPAK